MGAAGRPSARAALLAAVCVLAVCAAATAAGLTDAQRRGKRIYMEGKGKHGISAFLRGPGIKGPGSSFPCISCHLAGGGGQLEGGIRSADISYFNLTRAHPGVRPSGRVHPPYADEDLKAAITGCLDPAGNELDAAHPCYEMEEEDLNDLLAYLKVMDREPVPGVADNEVRVGILLPGNGPLAEAGEEVKALLAGHFAERNARGGLYARAMTLIPFRFDPSRKGSAAAAIRDPLEQGEVFCFVANIGVPAGSEAAKALAAEKVPVIAPLLSVPESGYGTDRYTFHLFASIRDQARVMVDFLAERPEGSGRRAVLLYSRDPHGEAGAEGAREQAKKQGILVAAELSYPPGAAFASEAVGRLRGESARAVLFFGAGEDAVSFLREAGRAGWRPHFLAPAQMAGYSVLSLPAEQLDTVYLAAPLTSPDPASREMAELARLREKYGVGDRHMSFQFMAYAGALLLEEGLKRSGKGVTREKFVDSIGNVWKLETGVTPPLTYTPNRRAGALGAAILKVDPSSRRYVPVTGWREPK